MSLKAQNSFQFLDGELCQNSYAENGEFRCFVEGVKCSHCLQKIESAFLTHKKVSNVRMDMGRSILTFTLTGKTPLSELAQTVSDLGFPTTPLKSNQSQENFEKNAVKQSLYKIGVAGVSAGNIMLLSVTLYSGAHQSEFRQYFEWISALLFLPVFFYCALPFYRVALADLKSRQISIDLPIVIAILAGTFLSFYHLIFTGGDIYFDSLAVLVFLLLSSRHFLSQLQKKFLNPKYLQSFITTTQAKVKTGRGWESRPLEALMPGDEILLESGQQIPADGNLNNEGGYLNASILTGESLPEKVGPRQQVFAGTTWMSSPVTMKISRLGDATRMGQIFQAMEKELLLKTPLLTLTDQVAKYFTFAILIISVGFFGFYFFIDAEEAVRRSLALIILACPCALALATPLTQSLALMKSAKLGAVIKNASALEALFQIKNIVFDKTGTLTTGQMRLRSISLNQMNSSDEQALVALESKSSHPVAFCLVEYFGKGSIPTLQVSEFRHLSSGGVTAEINGSQYTARKSTSLSSNSFGTSVDFFRDERLIAQFQFADEMRAQSRSTVQWLMNQNFNVYLLTGDLPAPSLQLGQLLNIPINQIYSSQSPEDKQKVIKSLPQSMMIGDGINDSVALAAANVGVSVHGSMKNSLAASDIYLTRSGVSLIPDLLILARETYKVIRRNLIISVIYNVSFGALALLGFVNPLVAAILMPISSVTVVLSSLLSTKKFRQLTPIRMSSRKPQGSSAFEQTFSGVTV